MRIFDLKDPGETVVLTFDFTKDLPAGATLSGTPSVSVSQFMGIVAPSMVNLKIPDPNVANIMSGTPQLSGALVLQKVLAGLSGNAYAFMATCATSTGEVLVQGGVLPVLDAWAQ